MFSALLNSVEIPPRVVKTKHASYIPGEGPQVHVLDFDANAWLATVTPRAADEWLKEHGFTYVSGSNGLWVRRG